MAPLDKLRNTITRAYTKYKNYDTHTLLTCEPAHTNGQNEGHSESDSQLLKLSTEMTRKKASILLRGKTHSFIKQLPVISVTGGLNQKVAG